jgi:pimeloyl-ACP methyl ester carboxylesterase
MRPKNSSKASEDVQIEKKKHSFLHNSVEGQGQTILLIHGFGATKFSWRFLIPDLAKRYKTICIDLKGFGGSQKPKDEKYSVNDHSSLITSFIKQMNLRNPILLGHSFGGGVALKTTLDLMGDEAFQPKKLILIDSIGFHQRFPLFIRLLRTPLLGSLGLRFLPKEKQAAAILKLGYFDEKKIPLDAVKEYSKALKTPEGQYAIIETAKQILPKKLDEIIKSYSSIQIPTLIIWGEADKIVPLEVGERLNRAIPNSRLEKIKKSGHMPHEESPEKVLPLLKEFLGSWQI